MASYGAQSIYISLLRLEYEFDYFPNNWVLA